MSLRSYEESLAMLSMPHEIYRLEPGGYGAVAAQVIPERHPSYGVAPALIPAAITFITGMVGLSNQKKQEVANAEAQAKAQRDKMLIEAAISNRQAELQARTAAQTPYYIVGGMVMIGIIATVLTRRG